MTEDRLAEIRSLYLGRTTAPDIQPQEVPLIEALAEAVTEIYRLRRAR